MDPVAEARCKQLHAALLRCLIGVDGGFELLWAAREKERRYQRDGDQPDRDPEAPSRSSIFSISCEQNSKARSGAWGSIRSGVSVER